MFGLFHFEWAICWAQKKIINKILTICIVSKMARHTVSKWNKSAPTPRYHKHKDQNLICNRKLQSSHVCILNIKFRPHSCNRDCYCIFTFTWLSLSHSVCTELSLTELIGFDLIFVQTKGKKPTINTCSSGSAPHRVYWSVDWNWHRGIAFTCCTRPSALFQPWLAMIKSQFSPKTLL